MEVSATPGGDGGDRACVLRVASLSSTNLGYLVATGGSLLWKMLVSGPPGEGGVNFQGLSLVMSDVTSKCFLKGDSVTEYYSDTKLRLWTGKMNCLQN